MTDIFKVKIGLSSENVFEFIEKPYSQQIRIQTTKYSIETQKHDKESFSK